MFGKRKRYTVKDFSLKSLIQKERKKTLVITYISQNHTHTHTQGAWLPQTLW